MILTKPRMLAAALTALAIAGAAPASTALAASSGPVSQTPVSYTPWLLRTTVNQVVQQLVQCGDTMYAVGQISAIGQSNHTYTRGNAFSFSATTGAVSAWDPQVNGKVHSVALSPDCSTAYLGGNFTTVRGVAAKDIVAVDTTTGAVKTAFAHSATNEVDTVQYTPQGLIVGGLFGKVNGTARTAIASMDPTTGKVTAYANLAFAGTYPGVTTKVYNSQLSHSGTRMLIEGVFTSINGVPRQQVAMLDLGASSLTLDPWYAPEFNQSCVSSESFYARAAAWSPDDNTVYSATTGYHGAGGANTGLCDAAFSFPSAPTTVTHTWINYTGCDSYYAVAADANDVYVGGHERWANNSHGCDAAGPGAVSRPGMASLSPVDGLATAWNPTRSLGYGAQDMLVTAAGLWVASDNFSDGQAQKCGGLTNHGGICFLPY